VDAPDTLSLVNPLDGTIGRFWTPEGEEISFSLAIDEGILLVLRSKEFIPTPGCPGMRYCPERLILLDHSLTERWSLPYPPYSGAILGYDSTLRAVLESTSSGLGWVNLDTGTRTAVVHGFPDEDDSGIGLPCQHEDGLYGFSKRGTLFRLALPLGLNGA
jgi:hypothetical protein